MTAAGGQRHSTLAPFAISARRASPILVSLFVSGAALLASTSALADPPVPPAAPAAPIPVAPPAAVGPVGPVAVAPPPSVPLAPPPLERRSPAAMSGGIASVTVGGILLVGGGLAGLFQATCTAECDHTPVIIGFLAAGGALLAVGIPLILYGSKTVTAPGGAVALVPRKPLPFMPSTPAPADGGWAIRF